MLGILLLILKIILWIVLGILGLILLLILMVLFTPIKYEVSGSKYDSILANGMVTYLFKFLRVKFHYSPEGYGYVVKVLFFTVLNVEEVTEVREVSDKDEEAGSSPAFGGIEEMEVDEFLDLIKGEKEAESAKREETGAESWDSHAVPAVSEKADGLEKAQSDGGSDYSKAPVETGHPELPEAPNGHPELPNAPTSHPEVLEERREDPTPMKKTTVSVEAPPKPLAKKDLTTSQVTSERPPEPTKKEKKKARKKVSEPKREKQGPSVLDQVKGFYTFLLDKENSGVLQFVIKRLFLAIGSVLPKRFMGKLHFGLDDPAMTGMITGGVCMLYTKYKDNLIVTPNFEENVIEGEGTLKGRILPWIFVYQALRIILDKRVRRLISYVRKQQKLQKQQPAASAG